MLVEVRRIGTGTITKKLATVKLIKEYSGMSLKEAKDWVDEFDGSGPLFSKHVQLKSIDVSNSANFEYALSQLNDGVHLIASDRSKRRQRKIVEIGLGDLNDKIEILSEELTCDVMGNYSYDSIKELITEFLTQLDEKTLDKLIENNEIQS